ncbi:hypothetical protein [Streptosporangium sp. NPDC051022]|uniref:hypothetical protein n=1 Tax=Streptosporangium sp. NPDC051022 TaxID=3155752 RepID=UPI00341EE01B
MLTSEGARPLLVIRPVRRKSGLTWRLDIPRTVPVHGRAESSSRDTVRKVAQTFADEFGCDIKEVEPDE